MIRKFRHRGAAVLVFCLAAASSYKEFRVARQAVAGPGQVSIAINHFDELKASLPPHGVSCYLSDMDLQQLRSGNWYLAEYSLAPIVLRAGAGCELVVGNFSDPAAATALILQNELQLLRRYGAGLMLLQRKRR